MRDYLAAIFKKPEDLLEKLPTPSKESPSKAGLPKSDLPGAAPPKRLPLTVKKPG